MLLLTVNHYQSLAYIPEQAKPISFSYFQERPDLYTTSKALVVYDVKNKNVLLSKNENLRFSPASTAKILSLIVALEHYNLDDILTYDTLLAGYESSRMGLYIGEEISVHNLLYGMMLPSGNDAARLLATNYPGGEDGFVSAMNKKAEELGLSSTYFVDPSGFEDKNYSTAYDLAILGSYAIQNKTIAQIVKTRQITVYNVSNTTAHVLKNINELLSIQGVTGIKTGFTNEAEGVLVTSFEVGENTYIIVVLGSANRFADTKELIQGIISNLKSEYLQQD